QAATRGRWAHVFRTRVTEGTGGFGGRQGFLAAHSRPIINPGPQAAARRSLTAAEASKALRRKTGTAWPRKLRDSAAGKRSTSSAGTSSTSHCSGVVPVV